MKKDYVIIILIGLVVALMATTVVLISRDADKKEEVIEDVVIAEPKPTIESKEEANAPAIATIKEESSQEPKEEVVEENVQEEPIEEEFDQFEIYEVDEDWIKYYSTKNQCYIVERDGKYYELGWELPGSVAVNYNVGWQYREVTPDNLTYLWLDVARNNFSMQTAVDSDIMISAGDFPIFQIKKDEKIRIYYADFVNSFAVSEAKFYGYTIMATDSQFLYPILDNNESTFAEEYGTYGINNIELCDMGDTPVEDIRDLTYGEEYKYTWYEGTQYNEIPLIANCKTFAISNTGKTLSVEPTKDGYLCVDVSVLPTGFYSIGKKALFEVVDEFHID